MSILIKEENTCEYCETFKNIYFEEHLPSAASIELGHYICLPYYKIFDLCVTVPSKSKRTFKHLKERLKICI